MSKGDTAAMCDGKASVMCNEKVPAMCDMEKAAKSRRVMIAGTGSGCGKTTIMCALLAALTAAGESVIPFKCGPDFIDPMFHRKAAGSESRNLDVFLMVEERVGYTLARHASDGNIALIEGVMGLYDGIGCSSLASSNHVSVLTGTPVILAVDAKGTALSVCAMIKGYMEFEKNHIRGVILNNVSEAMFHYYKEMIEDRLGIETIGFMPHIPGVGIESGRLGLKVNEAAGFDEKIGVLAEQARKSIDIGALLDIAAAGAMPDRVKKLTPVISSVAKEAVRLYVASDEAFCFWYEDNHDLLKALGAEIRFFSPVRDKGLPPDADGLVLWGGYPDLYAGELENNADMRRSLKTAIEAGLPVYAESGGFVYLMQSLTDSGGNEHDMLGVLPGQARMSDKLQSFGYHELSARRDTLLCEAGDRINAHFFNYFECVNEGNRGDSFIAEKNGKTFPCIVSKGNIFAGFQHLHFLGNPRFAENFIGACQKYRGRGDEA